MNYSRTEINTIILFIYYVNIFKLSFLYIHPNMNCTKFKIQCDWFVFNKRVDGYIISYGNTFVFNSSFLPPEQGLPMGCVCFPFPLIWGLTIQLGLTTEIRLEKTIFSSKHASKKTLHIYTLPSWAPNLHDENSVFLNSVSLTWILTWEDTWADLNSTYCLERSQAETREVQQSDHQSINLRGKK